MSLVDRIERKFLFKLTRGVALFFISLAVLSVICSFIYLIVQSVPPSIKLSNKEIHEIVSPNTSSEYNSDGMSFDDFRSPEQENPLRDIKLPFVIQKHFTDPQNMEILKEWLKPLNANEKGQFIEELQTVIEKSEKENKDVFGAINRYKSIKQEKVNQRELEASSPLEVYAIAASIGVSIMIVALFSLVLVLLAIERNTRIQEAS